MQLTDSEVEISRYWKILRRHSLPSLLIFLATATFVSCLGFTQEPIFEAEGKLRFKNRDSSSALAGLGDELGQLESLDRQESPIATEISIIRTAPIIQKTIEQLDLRNEEGSLISIQKFLSSLDVSHEGGTDILRVTYQSENTDSAKLIVNTLMSVYLKEHLLANRAEAAAARLFIEKQLPSAEKRSRETEAALRKFKEKNQVIALDEEASAIVISWESLRNKRLDVASQLADTKAQFEVLQERLGRNPQAALVATAISQSKGVQQALEDYQEVEATLADERARFREQHPMIVALEIKRSNLHALLHQRISNIISSEQLPTDINLQVGLTEANLVEEYIRTDTRLKGLQHQYQVIHEKENVYAKRISTLPRLEQVHRELVRELELAESTYALLLERLQEVQLAENQNVGNVRIIQPATIWGNPIAPRKQLYLLTGLVLGITLAASIALILETLDCSIKTIEEAKSKFGLTVIGVIPTFSKEERCNSRHSKNDYHALPHLIICSNRQSLSSEAYRMLSSNLKFLDSDYPPKVIMISSSVPQEGKSTVASNLAVSIAQTGQKVLLVDANLYQPIQHWIFRPWLSEMTHHIGLSHVLLEQASVEEATISVMPSLNLLRAGLVSPNPTALLDSQRMAVLMRELRSQYDYVIIDTPSLVSGASASIIGKMADGALLVVRPMVADNDSISYAKSLIQQSQQKVLGLVINSTVSNLEPYGQYLSDEFYLKETARR